MASLFKPVFFGKVQSLYNQRIETRFLLFIIPLNSFFTDKNKSTRLKIPLNKTSLLGHYYTALLLVSGMLIIALNILGIFHTGNPKQAYISIIISIFGVLLIIASTILNYFLGKPNKYQKKQRTIFQNSIGINALPVWLGKKNVRDILDSNRETKLAEGWKNKIRTGEYTTDEFYDFYTILSYEIAYAPSSKAMELFNILDSKLSR